MRLNRSLFLFHMRCGNATCLWSFSSRWNWSDMVSPLRHSSLSDPPSPDQASLDIRYAEYQWISDSPNRCFGQVTSSPVGTFGRAEPGCRRRDRLAGAKTLIPLRLKKRAGVHRRQPFLIKLGSTYQSQQPSISMQHSASSEQQSVCAMATPAIDSKSAATLYLKSLFFIGMFLFRWDGN